MTLPDIAAIYDVIESTWPAAAVHKAGPWQIREGAGGGQRVSATTALGPITPHDIAMAEEEMLALGQPKLFMVRQGEDELDQMLAAAGYAIHDPVNAYVAPLSTFEDKHPPLVCALLAWEPLAIMLDSNIRSAKNMSAILNKVAEKIRVAAKNKDQADIFSGEVTPQPTINEAVNYAAGQESAAQTNTSGDLFAGEASGAQQPEAPSSLETNTTGSRSGSESGSKSGNSGRLKDRKEAARKSKLDNIASSISSEKKAMTGPFFPTGSQVHTDFFSIFAAIAVTLKK